MIAFLGVLIVVYFRVIIIVWVIFKYLLKVRVMLLKNAKA